MNLHQISRSILLVEDDVPLGLVTSEVLKHLGHDVDWAISANQALDTLSGEMHFDAMLLDLGLGLGDDDGVSLVDTLRERGCVVPPLLIFSAQPVDVLRVAARTIGAAAILQKPCTATELDAAIAHAISGQTPQLDRD